MVNKTTRAVERLYEYLIAKAAQFEHQVEVEYQELVKDNITLRLTHDDDVILIHSGNNIALENIHKAVLRDGFARCLKGKKDAGKSDTELMLDELMGMVDELNL